MRTVMARRRFVQAAGLSGLSHRDLRFNGFHGGKTTNSIDRTVFITGLVWGRRYIGPMRLPQADAIFGNGFQT